MKKKFVTGLAISIFSLSFSAPSVGASDANTVITVYHETGNFLRTDPVDLEIKHPNDVECDAYPPSNPTEYYNCNFSIEYQFTSSGSKIDFFSQDGLVLDGNRESVGTFSVLLLDAGGLNQWRTANVKARIHTSGKIVLGLKPHVVKTYSTKQQTPINAKVITSEEAARRKAALEADKAKAEADALAKEMQLLAAKQLSITCSKGSSKKVVKGDPPKCPAGFTFAGNTYLTYKAFSTCKLYKKDSFLAGARLSDSSRTLELIRYGKGYLLSHLNGSDFNCAMKALNVSAAVKSRIFSTRAIDGQQSARVGPMTASWTYHPNDGLNITFTYLKI